MWDFFETVRHRHSVRKFLPDAPVEAEKLHAVLETACTAPSAGDLQAYHIVVVSQPDMREQLSRAAQDQAFIREAPASLVFFCDTERSADRFGKRGKKLYAIQDATIAAAYTQLAAVAAGLGSIWVGEFDEKAVTKLCGVGDDLRPVAILSVGYPAELPEPTRRRPLEDVVTMR
ncbi:MAG: nitroreductase [Gammaproteobacteria bacterium]|nr:MAG: nitroreductase [Gammaproteobacteria bacterium]TND02638.1 MAG: nitroreductase [Gammaproteobacteria bacterium]